MANKINNMNYAAIENKNEVVSGRDSEDNLALAAFLVPSVTAAENIR